MISKNLKLRPAWWLDAVRGSDDIVNMVAMDETLAISQACSGYPSHLRPVFVHRLHAGFPSSHFTCRILDGEVSSGRVTKVCKYARYWAEGDAIAYRAKCIQYNKCRGYVLDVPASYTTSLASWSPISFPDHSVLRGYCVDAIARCLNHIFFCGGSKVLVVYTRFKVKLDERANKRKSRWSIMVSAPTTLFVASVED
jgi:hypothetical protein